MMTLSESRDEYLAPHTTCEKDVLMSYQSINPYDGRILKTFEELTDKQLDAALDTAATCFKTWRHTTFAERAAVVAKAALSCTRGWTSSPAQ